MPSPGPCEYCCQYISISFVVTLSTTNKDLQFITNLHITDHTSFLPSHLRSFLLLSLSESPAYSSIYFTSSAKLPAHVKIDNKVYKHQPS